MLDLIKHKAALLAARERITNEIDAIDADMPIAEYMTVHADLRSKRVCVDVALNEIAKEESIAMALELAGVEHG